MVKLNDEIVQALLKCDGEPLEVEAPGAKRSYVIVDAHIHRAAVEALEQQRIHESILAGFQDLEAGKGQTVEEAFDNIRRDLGVRAGKTAWRSWCFHGLRLMFWNTRLGGHNITQPFRRTTGSKQSVVRC